MLIFEKKLIPKVAFPAGVVVKANQKGCITESLMIEWLSEVWTARRGARTIFR